MIDPLLDAANTQPPSDKVPESVLQNHLKIVWGKDSNSAYRCRCRLLDRVDSAAQRNLSRTPDAVNRNGSTAKGNL